MRTAWLILALLAQGAAQSTVRPGVITGQILGFDGVPAAGLRVAVMDPPAKGVPAVIRTFTETDSAGRYRLADVPPGRYFITAGPLDASTYFPGVAAIEQAVAVTVVSGTAQENRDFRLAIPLMRLSGRVIREADPPDRQSERRDQVALTGPGTSHTATIECCPMSLVPVTQALAPLGPDDSFEFRNLRPGLYQLSVVGAALQMQGVPVSLNDQHVTGYVLTVPQSAVQATVSVSATVAGGEPLPMFPFRLMTPLEPPYKAPHRNFSIPLNSENTSSVAGPVAVVAGEYRAVIGWGAGPGLPEGYSVESVRAGTIDLLSENLVLAPGDKAQIHVVLKVSSPPPGRRVAGRVKSAAVINAARIGVTGRITYVAAVGADGTFEFPHVIPGRYLVQIFPDNSSAAGAAIVGNLVMAGYELTSLEIPAALPSFKISGRGLGEEELRRKGRLGPGPVVAVLSEPARSAAEPPGFRPGHFDPEDNQGRLAPDGSFLFSGVPPGKYLLYFASGMASDISPLPKPIKLTVKDKDIDRLKVDIGPALW